jgi:asparagine synthase (glutamine-hydrolysing)
MLGSMDHRGPNGSGYLYKQGGNLKQVSNFEPVYEVESPSSSFYTLAMAQNRLSINDRRPVAIQPIHNEDKSIFLIHNGEIYNHRQLRKYLQEKNHRFYTHCDSEAIIHLYEEEGLDGLEKLIGAYAFCLWDIKRDRFIMGRDKYGEKPLFYSYDNGCLIFNSEIKAFRQVPQFNFDFSPLAAGVYLAYGNMVPPFTWFKNIRKLEPGHLFIWEGKNAPVTRPMHLTYDPRQKNGSFDDYQDRFERVFHEVIKDTVETRDEDVDCCVCLSGGIDSSLTTLFVNDTDSSFSKFSLFGKTEGSDSELSRAQHLQ